MESALLDPTGGHRWVVYDEAWRLMSHPALLRRMDAHWRLARHYGIANMLIFHKLSDLDNVGAQGSAARALASSLLANAETRIVYRQESDQLVTTPAGGSLIGRSTGVLEASARPDLPSPPAELDRILRFRMCTALFGGCEAFPSATGGTRFFN